LIFVLGFLLTGSVAGGGVCHRGCLRGLLHPVIVSFLVCALVCLVLEDAVLINLYVSNKENTMKFGLLLLHEGHVELKHHSVGLIGRR